MIYDLFFKGLRSSPENISVVTSKGEKLTFLDVERRVNQWAQYLLSNGVKRQERVSLLTKNEDLHFFIYLALDRINAVYVPFDTDMPEQQVEEGIQTLHMSHCLFDEGVADTYKGDKKNVVTLNPIVLTEIYKKEPIELPVIYEANPENISYIMGSSGSTGKRKYIPIMGAGLIYWAKVEKELLDLQSSDNVLSTRSPAYDARVSEYVRALSAQSPLHLLSGTDRKDISLVLEYCKTHSIACLLLIARQLYGQNTEKLIRSLKEAGLKHLMVTGDACTLRLQALCKKYNINLWNCYGSTETTFGLSIIRLNDIEMLTRDGHLLVPIGLPYGDDVKAHILEGELFVETPYLTPGYIGANDGSICFKEIEGEETRVFKTGDKFSLLNGYLIYEGRAHFDTHCKVSGVKVTPQPIEDCLNAYVDHIGRDNFEVAVVIKPFLEHNRPYAYLSFNGEINKIDFFEFLKKRLKKEETPIFYRLEKLPRLSISQKLDRKGLIARKDKQEERLFTDELDSIVTENQEILKYEIILKKIWCKLFKVDSVSVDLEFIMLGGDSMLATEMLARLNDELDRSYQYSELLSLDKITIREISNQLALKQQQDSSRAIINKLVYSSESKETLFLLPALLGEGYFSYKHLALKAAQKFDKNVFGLTEAGLYDKSLLSGSLKEAVARYIKAIKHVQPKGPYHLMGFSFGSTLGFEVSRQLEAEGEKVAELHLIDGYPPMLYQRLSNQAHVKLLESLINFMIMTLNNHFFNEKLKAIKLSGLETLNKEEQVDFCFDFLRKKIKNERSIRLIEVARRHLSFMLNTSEPESKLHVWPNFYLSDKSQDYLDVINKIPGLTSESPEYRYFFWNHYFSNMTRNGVKIKLDHLGLLQPRTDGLDRFWERSHDFLFNIKVDHQGPLPTYALHRSSYKQKKLDVFFLNEYLAKDLKKELATHTIDAKISACEKSYREYQQPDDIYSSGFSLSANICEENLPFVISLLESRKIPKSEKVSTKPQGVMFFNKTPELRFQWPHVNAKLSLIYPQAPCLTEKTTSTIDLTIFKNRGYLFTLSFHYDALPKVVIKKIFEAMHILPETISNNHALLYQYDYMLLTGSLYQAMAMCSEWLGEFIGSVTDELSIIPPEAQQITVKSLEPPH